MQRARVLVMVMLLRRVTLSMLIVRLISANERDCLLLRGAAKSAEDDFIGQSDDADEALSILLAIEPEETYLIAFASWVIAALARELPCLPDVDYLARIARRIHWTPELNHFRFQLLAHARMARIGLRAH